MEAINPEDFVDNSCYELKYVDSEGWTVPRILTQERLDSIYKDLSIEKMRITTGQGFRYELKVI